MRAADIPRTKGLSNAYDEKRRSAISHRRSGKSLNFEVSCEVVEQITARGVRFVPVARCTNGDCLRGCYRECRIESEHTARSLANRLRERLTTSYRAAPDSEISAEEAA